MTFAELKARAAELYELCGFTDTAYTPDWDELVNRAWEEYAWEAEIVRSEADIASVAGQAIYSLDTPAWKLITDCYYNSEPIEMINEAWLRRIDSRWLIASNGTPSYWWRPTPSTIRLYVPPDTGALVIKLYGVRGAARMTGNSDEPSCPVTHHEGIAKRAYWFAAERFARGEERQALSDQADQYVQYLRKLKHTIGAQAVMGQTRRMALYDAERVSL